MRDELVNIRPHYNEDGILNLDSSDSGGTHWTAWHKRGNKTFYFDSFGNLTPPFEFIKYIQDKSTIYYNSDDYQTYNSVYCGQMCILFLYLKRYSSINFKICPTH